MTDVLLILVSILLAATLGAAFQYYGLLRKAQKEYESARDSVEDIVLSFNRQLKHESEKLELVAYKVEAVSSKIDGTMKRADEATKAVQAIDPKFAAVLEAKDQMLGRLEETNKKVCDVATSQEALNTRIVSLEEQARQPRIISEPSIEPVIPIRRDRALAPLTETELSALEFLASEGPKTAPEIKWRIRLSREHTARLMKKLYESGYLERETNKIPFKYSVKKEMERLLKKTENETAA